MKTLKATLFLTILCLLAACGSATQEQTAQDEAEVVVDAIATEAASEENIAIVEEAAGDIIADAVQDLDPNATLTAEEGMELVGEIMESIEDEGQNDAGSGGDAGDNRDEATVIEPGSYSGRMDFGEGLSLDDKDVYRVNVSANTLVRVTVSDASGASSPDFFVYTHNEQQAFSDSYEKDAAGGYVVPLVLASDGHIDISLSAFSLLDYALTVTTEPSSDGGTAGDAANLPTAASPLPSGEAFGVLGAASPDGTPDQDCYAHGGAAISFTSTPDQRFRRNLIATNYDASGQPLGFPANYQGFDTPTELPADANAVAVCFTANINGNADVLYFRYTFSVGEGPDLEAAAAEAARAAFDGCALFSAETLLTTLGLESAAESELDPDTGSCTIMLADVGLAYAFNIASDDEFSVLDMVAETVPIEELGDNAFYANLNGQGLVQWQIDGTTYQLLAFDFVNGVVSAETLTQVAQTINP